MITEEQILGEWQQSGMREINLVSWIYKHLLDPDTTAAHKTEFRKNIRDVLTRVVNNLPNGIYFYHNSNDALFVYDDDIDLLPLYKFKTMTPAVKPSAFIHPDSYMVVTGIRMEAGCEQVFCDCVVKCLRQEVGKPILTGPLKKLWDVLTFAEDCI